MIRLSAFLAHLFAGLFAQLFDHLCNWVEWHW